MPHTASSRSSLSTSSTRISWPWKRMCWMRLYWLHKTTAGWVSGCFGQIKMMEGEFCICHARCTNVRSGLGYPRKLAFGRNWLKPRIRSRWPLKIVFTRLITPSVSILLTKAVKCYFESWTHASVENYCLLSITFALWTLSWSRGTRRKCLFCPSAYPSVPSNRLRLLVCEGRHLWKLFE